MLTIFMPNYGALNCKSMPVHTGKKKSVLEGGGGVERENSCPMTEITIYVVDGVIVKTSLS